MANLSLLILYNSSRLHSMCCRLLYQHRYFLSFAFLCKDLSRVIKDHSCRKLGTIFGTRSQFPASVITSN